MRFLISILFCLISFLGNAQDSLFFKDNSIVATEIIKIDSANAIIKHQIDGSTTYQAISVLNKIIYQGQEINLDYWLNRGSSQHHEKANEQLRKSNPYDYGKFAISTNLTAFSLQGDRTGRRYFYDNAFFTIEPEYVIHERISVKFPILIGLNPDISAAPVEVSLEYDASWNYSIESYEDEASILTPEIGGRTNYYAWYYLAESHKRNLQFQLGINPKFFLTENQKVRPYIGQSFNVGFVNLRSVDYFLDFAVVYVESTGRYHQTFRGERQLISNSQALAFKYEGMFGLDFNLTRGLNFSTELGYSNTNKAVNTYEDRVFIRSNETDEYELVKSSAYSAERQWTYGIRGRTFFRIHLVYRFGGIKNTL